MSAWAIPSPIKPAPVRKSIHLHWSFTLHPALQGMTVEELEELET